MVGHGTLLVDDDHKSWLDFFKGKDVDDKEEEDPHHHEELVFDNVDDLVRRLRQRHRRDDASPRLPDCYC